MRIATFPDLDSRRFVCTKYHPVSPVTCLQRYKIHCGRICAATESTGVSLESMQRPSFVCVSSAQRGRNFLSRCRVRSSVSAFVHEVGRVISFYCIECIVCFVFPFLCVVLFFLSFAVYVFLVSVQLHSFNSCIYAFSLPLKSGSERQCRCSRRLRSRGSRSVAGTF